MGGFGWDDEAADRSWNRGSRELFEQQWMGTYHLPHVRQEEEQQMVVQTRSEAREAAYAAIDGERDYQDQKWPKDSNNEPTVGESIVLLQQYVAKATEAWTSQVGDTAALDQIRKVAAIAVRAMEKHGAIRRE